LSAPTGVEVSTAKSGAVVVGTGAADVPPQAVSVRVAATTTPTSLVTVRVVMLRC
jgi:hypothetical protein